MDETFTHKAFEEECEKIGALLRSYKETRCEKDRIFKESLSTLINSNNQELSEATTQLQKDKESHKAFGSVCQKLKALIEEYNSLSKEDKCHKEIVSLLEKADAKPSSASQKHLEKRSLEISRALAASREKIHNFHCVLQASLFNLRGLDDEIEGIYNRVVDITFHTGDQGGVQPAETCCDSPPACELEKAFPVVKPTEADKIALLRSAYTYYPFTPPDPKP